MKTINVTFTDEEFLDFSAKKGNDNWHDYLLRLAGVDIPVETYPSKEHEGL